MIVFDIGRIFWCAYEVCSPLKHPYKREKLNLQLLKMKISSEIDPPVNIYYYFSAIGHGNDVTMKKKLRWLNSKKGSELCLLTIDIDPYLLVYFFAVRPSSCLCLCKRLQLGKMLVPKKLKTCSLVYLYCAFWHRKNILYKLNYSSVWRQLNFYLIILFRWFVPMLSKCIVKI